MVPKGHWKNFQNHIIFANTLAKKYEWDAPEDWNNLSQKHFKDSGGDGLLRGTYNGSPWKFIVEVVAISIYPNYFWCEWKIGAQRFWKDPEKVRYALDVLAGYKGFISLDSFYTVSQEEYHEHRITDIQNKFGTHMGMLKFAYPEKDWKEYKFRPVTRGYWDKHEHLVAAIKDIEHEKGIYDLSDWYKQTTAIIDEYCGTGLLVNKYSSSLFALLKDVHPEYPWKPYLFEKAPHRYWFDDDNCRGWLSDFMISRGYTTPGDLYKTRYETLIEFPSGRGIIDRFNGSYIRLFTHLHPELDINLFFKVGQSKIANEWLSYREKQDGAMQREYSIPSTRYKVDGCITTTKTVYEFLGDYWHGNPLLYPSDNKHPVTAMTYGEMHAHTIKRLNHIKSLGYTVIFIWECDWKASLKVPV